MDEKNYFKSHFPTFSNGSPFLGFKTPGDQTFTSFSPSSDMNAYLQAVTGMSGHEQRNLLQSRHGTQILSQAASGKLADSVAYLDSSTYHSRASCTQDADCPEKQVCSTFNDQVFGASQGPTCSPVVYPEVELGNKNNKGVPLRQYSNYCLSDNDCKGIDEFSGKPKHGMACDHLYQGPEMYSETGICKVQYESKGKRYNLSVPSGWTIPLNEKLTTCEKDSDCGLTGIDGWSRCTKAGNGNSYCLFPGKTETLGPSELNKLSPHDNIPRTIYSTPEPASLRKFKK